MAPPKRGFSLLEMMVVVAIVGVMSALSVVALDGLRHSADVSTSIETLGGYVSEGRMQAMRRGFPVVLLAYVPADTSNCPRMAVSWHPDWRKCMRFYLIRDQGLGSISNDLTSSGPLPGFDPDSLPNQVLLEQTTWSSFVTPVANGGSAALPAPFTALKPSTACSFCTLASVGDVPMGVVVFNPDGTVEMTGGGNGGGLVVQARNLAGGERTFIVTAPLGLTRVF